MELWWWMETNSAIKTTINHRGHFKTQKQRPKLYSGICWWLCQWYHGSDNTSQSKCKHPNSKYKGCKKKKQKQNKPWFNQTCQQMKNNLASRIRNNLNDHNLIHQYKRLRKSYKQSLKRSKRNYDRMVWDKLSSLQNSNPKAFWETLNKFRNLDATHKENPIPAEEWKIHFAKLLNLPHSLDHTHREHVGSFIKQNRDSIFNELNFQIKASEILESTSSLKNNKAFRERQHPSAPRSVNEKPIHWPTGWKL